MPSLLNQPKNSIVETFIVDSYRITLHQLKIFHIGRSKKITCAHFYQKLSKVSKAKRALLYVIFRSVQLEHFSCT